MKYVVKIPRALFEQAKCDLARPHPFAYERGGLFSTRCSRRGATVIVHCVDYHPIPDEHYLPDDSVGARFGPLAITEAMARALNNSVGQIHVHMHGGSGLPGPSSVDREELPPMVRAFQNANSREIHGWMILAERDAYTSLCIPHDPTPVDSPQVSIPGFPTVINRRTGGGVIAGKVSGFLNGLKRGKASNKRFSRQSFLGDESDRIIREAKIGLVGISGGGSHVIQQIAHLGFRNLVLCDDDVISESNLNRLVGGTSADVRKKRPKTEIGKRTVERLHKDGNVLARPLKWEAQMEDLMDCDLIFGCVDSYAARRDLEAFCRRCNIPYLDIGMDVVKATSGGFEIYGQVILSMPGCVCMQCMGFLNEKVLAQEAGRYGDAGDQPQVVWSNGLLASAAVGVAVDLLTDWSKTLRHPVYLAFTGSTLSFTTDNRLLALRGVICRHYPLQNVGDAVLRRL